MGRFLITLVMCAMLTGVAHTQTSWFPLGTLVRSDVYPHGLFAFNDSLVTVDITDSTVWYPITNAGHNLFSNDYGEYIVDQGDSITIVIPGDYYINMNFSVMGPAGQSIKWRFGIMKNGVLFGYTSSRITTTNDIGNISIQGYINNAAYGDVIKPVFINKTNST